MTDQAPTQSPPVSSVDGEQSTPADQARPTLNPPEAASSTADAAGGLTAWNNNKRVTALWCINQNRNSWAYINGVGWKRLSNASDSANLALTVLAAHAKQSKTNYTYRDEQDGLIHESYVW
ncbi:MAG: hypothetical protein VKP70_11580 [Cyanobacteriota bacterium]|nr:hypothetical protein [Cyanobacteriota bacterium]